MGQNPTEEELKDMISEIDKVRLLSHQLRSCTWCEGSCSSVLHLTHIQENKGVIDLNDFLNLISLKTHTTSQQTQSPAPGPGLSLTETLHNASEDEMREAFRVFDRDSDGLINETEMLLTLLGLGETGITEEKVREIIAEADDDKDGKLSYQEFIKYLGVIPKASEL